MVSEALVKSAELLLARARWLRSWLAFRALGASLFTSVLLCLYVCELGTKVS